MPAGVLLLKFVEFGQAICKNPDIGTFLGATRLPFPRESKRVRIYVGPIVPALCCRVPGNVVGRSRPGGARPSQTDGDCLDGLGQPSGELLSSAAIRRPTAA